MAKVVLKKSKTYFVFGQQFVKDVAVEVNAEEAKYLLEETNGAFEAVQEPSAPANTATVPPTGEPPKTGTAK